MVIIGFCFLIFLKNCHQTSGLVELPAAPDNDILKTAATVRDTVNNIFKALHIDPSVKRKPQIEYFSLVHNYLVKLTSRDYVNLKEIARLTRVDKNRDKTNDNIVYFMTILDELLNEIPNMNETEVKSDINIDLTKKTEYTAALVPEIKKLEEIFEIKASQYDVVLDNIDVDDLMKYFKFNETIYYNAVPNVLGDQAFEDSDSEENSTIVDVGEVWIPSGRRIFKGKRTKIKHFPFMATIDIFSQFQCAGSIISADLVITACSCVQLAYNNRFFRENPKFLTVRVGSTFYAGGGEVISVLEVHFHPEYEPKSLKNNLVLLRLEHHIRFSKHGKGKKIKKIALDTNGDAMAMNTDGVTIVGWGAMTRANKIKNPWTNRLAYATLDIYSLEDCQDIYTSAYVTKKHFCAGFISKGGGACNRDVGGPGIVDGVLTGVVSFGSPVCGELDAPTVFTRIAYYIDWIETIMEQKVEWALVKTTTPWPFITYTNPLPSTNRARVIPIDSNDGHIMDHPESDLDIKPTEREPVVVKKMKIQKLLRDKKVFWLNTDSDYEVKTTTTVKKISVSQSVSKTSTISDNSMYDNSATKLMADSRENIRIEEKVIDELIDSALGRNNKNDYEELLREDNEREKKQEKIKNITKAQISKKRATVATELDLFTEPLINFENERPKVTKKKTEAPKNNLNKHRFSKSDRPDDNERKHASKSSPKVAIAREAKAILPVPGSNPDEDIKEALFYLGTLYESIANDSKKVKLKDPKSASSEGMSIELFKST